MIINLENKVILVTGSSRGIGAALAINLAKEKANVVINYNKSAENAQEIYEKCCMYNKNCILIKADVTDLQQVQNMHRKIIDQYGKIDALVNNAGKCEDALIQLMSEETWNDVIDTNLKSCFFCSKEFSKSMIINKNGKIINIASLKGINGCVGQVNYSASKAGIIGLTKTLAKELGQYNIEVNAICPGFIITDLNRHNEQKKIISQIQSSLRNNFALDDLINFIVLFLSDNIKGISGQVFNLDSRIL